MTEPIPSLAEAMAEIRRLRARLEAMEAEVAIARGALEQWDAEQHEKVRWYRARAQAAEAELAIAHGTMSKPAENEPARYEHHVPPSAPPHDE